MALEQVSMRRKLKVAETSCHSERSDESAVRDRSNSYEKQILRGLATQSVRMYFTISVTYGTSLEISNLNSILQSTITFCDVFQLLSTGAIGLLVGALLAEGAIFIPYWRSLPSNTFYSLHKEYGPRLYRFFAPLTIAPSILSLSAAGSCTGTADAGRWPTLIACLFFIGVLVTYGGYFKRANARLATATLCASELAQELARWESWHWKRVVVGVLAFVAALLGLSMQAEA